MAMPLTAPSVLKRAWSHCCALTPPAQVTEDFLEEYGWKRLYREIGELGKSETVMTTQSHDLRENARTVRERLERNRYVLCTWAALAVELGGLDSGLNRGRVCCADQWWLAGSVT